MIVVSISIVDLLSNPTKYEMRRPPLMIKLFLYFESESFCKKRSNIKFCKIIWGGTIVSNLVRNFDSEKSHISIMLR